MRVTPRAVFALLALASTLTLGCASDRDPDDPAYGSEQGSSGERLEEERDWVEEQSNE